MSAPSESEIIKKFKESIAKGIFDEGMKVTYRVEGGMPSEQIKEEFRLSGNGKATVREMNVLTASAPQEVSTDLDKSATREVFKNVEVGLDRMVTRSEASFLPDTAVGSVTIEVEGKKTTLFFPAEEESIRKGRDLAPEILTAGPGIAETMRFFKDKSRQILGKGQEDRK